MKICLIAAFLSDSLAPGAKASLESTYAIGKMKLFTQADI